MIGAIRWVGQKDECGCVAACVAMLLGTDYRHASYMLRASGLVDAHAFIAWGTSFEAVFPLLKEAGWQRNDDTPEVFLVDVWGGINGHTSLRHAVIAFPGGMVLDPGVEEWRDLRGYYHVGDALGLRRVLS